MCPYKIQKHKEEKLIIISRRGTMHRAQRKGNSRRRAQFIVPLQEAIKARGGKMDGLEPINGSRNHQLN